MEFDELYGIASDKRWEKAQAEIAALKLDRDEAVEMMWRIQDAVVCEVAIMDHKLLEDIETFLVRIEAAQRRGGE